MQKFRRTGYGLMIGCVAAASLLLTTGMSSYKTVTVSVDGKAFRTGTYASETVASFLAHHGVHETRWDLVKPARGDFVQNGARIDVVLAKTVTVRNGAGAPETIHTLAHTVRELLADLRIKPGLHVRVNRSLEQRLSSGMTITVTQEHTVTRENTEPIPFAVVRQPDGDYATGTDVVAQQGQPGAMRVVTSTLYKNGKLVMTKTERTILQDPVNEIIDVGTAVAAPPVATNSDASITASDVLTVVATAYSNPGGYTATGAPAEYGDVAVDPSVIPLGTKLYIPGYGYGIADDTGGAIVGYRIDLCFNSVQQAIDWGRQTVKVYILGRA